MPPRFGTLDIKAWAASAPVIAGYKTEPWLLKQAQILHMAYEVDTAPSDNLVPPAMHPVIPAYVTFIVTAYPESPFGKFAIAEVRMMGRTGVRPRGFVLRSFVDNEAARRELASRWGYPAAAGEVRLHLRHDRVQADVSEGGKRVLEFEMIDREAIGGGDIQYVASMHLARNKDDERVVLVQVDPEYVFHKAERGKPRLATVDDAAWRMGGHLKFTNPVSISFATCDVTIPKIRYVCDPERPAIQGTTKVAA